MTATSVDDLLVDDRLCLALHAASRAMTARYRPVLDALGLTYPQYMVMSVLWEDGPQSVGALAQRLSLDSSTLSPLLRRLAATGLVTRDRDPDDERVVRVSPTPAGRRLRRRAAGVPREICDATGLGLEQQARLVRQLRRLASALGDDRG